MAKTKNKPVFVQVPTVIRQNGVTWIFKNKNGVVAVPIFMGA